MTINDIIAALYENPFDPSNLSCIHSIIKDATLEERQNDPRYAALFLLIKILGGTLSQNEIDLLIQKSPQMDDNIKSVLLVSLLRSNSKEYSMIFFLLNELKFITDSLAIELTNWLGAINPDKKLRDAISNLICLKCSNDDIVKKTSGYIESSTRVCDIHKGDLYPRRHIPKIISNDPFLKLVPPDSPDKAYGLKILIISDFNIAGQLTALMRALNKYTNHTARCVILQDDYLSYDRDVTIRDESGNLSNISIDEARLLVEKADFFHVGRRLFNLPGIDWNKYLSPQNTVFQYFGSYLRDNGKQISEFHEKSKFRAITNLDWTVYRNLPNSFYHIQPYMIDMDDFPVAQMNFTGPLRICHAPSNSNYRKIKRSDFILNVIDELVANNSDVQKILIEGLPNRQCLKVKSNCHIHVVSLRYGPGLNAIESAAMGLLPLVQLPNFVQFLLPNCPLINITEKTLYKTLKHLIDNPNLIEKAGKQCQKWARQNYDSKLLVKSYWYLYDFIYHGFSVDYPDIYSEFKHD
ncbi:MAG TPA: hypothetical protein VE912_07355 [Bacteroidales bacterium]|nr:hypothetical protein [Bacteroidales bacterium]